MELQSRVMTGSQPGPHLLITGGVHGDEFEPMEAIRRLMLEINPAELRGKVTLVPVVNEPAFLRGARTAEDNLDLARTCPGNPQGTITERIAAALSALIRTADVYIDLHTGGTEFTLLPLVGYMLHPRKEVLDQQRRLARAFGLPIIWGTHPALEGRSLSVARDANIPALYAEWGGGGGCDPAGVAGYVTGCLAVLRELGGLPPVEQSVQEVDLPSSLLPTSRPVEPIMVEDPRENSGHLQICNTAPCDGYFEPAVRLGGRVTVGDLLGKVTDALGTRIQEVRSGQAGLVFCLHTFRRVKQGGAVAVVLEGA